MTSTSALRPAAPTHASPIAALLATVAALALAVLSGCGGGGGTTPPPPPPAAPPIITSLQPGEVPTAGASFLVLGTGFEAGSQVKVGGAAAAATVLSATQLAVAAPAHAAGAVDVQVTNPDGQQDVLAGGLTYADVTPPPPPAGPPTISGLAPTSGPEAGGTAVVLTGTNLDAHVAVTFGGLAATVSGVTGTQLTAVAPPHPAGAVDVVVTNPDQQSATRAAGFTYQAPLPPPAPTVAGVAPATGSTAGGEAVTVSGTGFAAGATVTFGGAAAAVVSTTATALTVTTPPHAAGAVAVAVQNPDGQQGSAAGAFTYQVPPPPPLALTAVTPAGGQAAGGTSVTLTGTGFVTGATATFGGLPATGVTVLSATRLTATTPAHAAGAVDVVVTNPGGASATLASGFSYAAVGLPAPAITGVTPATATVNVATTVDIAGTNIVNGASVTIGGVAATVLGQVTVSGLQVSVVGVTPGPADVVVRNPDGQVATATGLFAFVAPPPVITTLNRLGCPPAGGLTMLIVGTGLSAAATVTFGGVPATGVGIEPISKGLQLTIPAHAEGFVDVVVTNPDGQSDTFAGFHYGPAPVITGFTPAGGRRDDLVTVTGDFFDPTAQVRFGGNAAVVSSRAAGSITVIVPKMNPGPYTLVVVNQDQQTGTSATTFLMH